MGKFAIIITFLCYYNNFANAQVFGGRTSFPSGGYNERIGYQHGPLHGSLSKDFDHRGLSGPMSVGGGANVASPKGHGVGAGFQHVPGQGGFGSVSGQVGLLSNKDHQLNAFAQHGRFLDKDFKPIGPERKTTGLNYQHQSGLSVQGSKTFGPGMKPDKQVMLNYERKF